MTTLSIIIAVILLPYLYNFLFPFKPPQLDKYFSPGEQFFSEAEGLTQTIIRQEGRRVYCELKFAPGAAGPPEHRHTQMDEFATVVKGTLTAKIDGQFHQLQPGDRLELKRGLYHKMYNESQAEVILRAEKDDEYVPVEFAYSLGQIYPLMKAGGGLTLKMFGKICVLDDLFDMQPFGPPSPLFRLIKKLVKPYARLLGVTPYDERSKPALQSTSAKPN